MSTRFGFKQVCSAIRIFSLLFALALAVGCSAEKNGATYSEGIGKYMKVDGKTVRAVEGRTWFIPAPDGFKDLATHRLGPEKEGGGRDDSPDDKPWHSPLRMLSDVVSLSPKVLFTFYALPGQGIPEYSTATLWLDTVLDPTEFSAKDEAMGEALKKYMTGSIKIDEALWVEMLDVEKDEIDKEAVWQQGDDEIRIVVTRGYGAPVDPADSDADLKMNPAVDAWLGFNFGGKKYHLNVSLCPLKDQATLNDAVSRLLAWKKEFIKLNR